MPVEPRPSPFRRPWLGLVRVQGLAYAGLLGLLAGCQRSLIYFPSKGSETSLRTQAERSGLQAWLDEEGNVIGWKSARAAGSPAPAHRLLVFHGNAGAAVHRSYFHDGFTALDDGSTWEVHILEYPGYGARSGRPSEKAFDAAGRDALGRLRAIDDRPVHLLGESLGGGVACHLAGELPDRIAGVLLITPFTLLADVGAHHYPFVPVRLLLRDRYDNVAALRTYAGPVAFLVAEQDEVIPASLGRRLHDAYNGPKRLWSQPSARHNTLDYRHGAPWWREVSDFLLDPPPATEHAAQAQDTP